MFKYSSANSTYNHIDANDDLVIQCNKFKYRSIKMTPIAKSKREPENKTI